jgi:hypothetical protein
MLVHRMLQAAWKLKRLSSLEQARHRGQIDRLRRRAAADLKGLETMFSQDQEMDLSPWYDPHIAPQAKITFKNLEKLSLEQLKDRARQDIRILQQAEDELLCVEQIQASQLSDKQQFDEFERLSRCEQRLENSMYRAMHELERYRKNHPAPGDESDSNERPASPYRNRQGELLEQLHRETEKLSRTIDQETAEIDAIEELRNEPTEEQPDDKPQPDKELAAAQAPPVLSEVEGISTGEMSGNVTPIRDTGLQPVQNTVDDQSPDEQELKGTD